MTEKTQQVDVKQKGYGINSLANLWKSGVELNGVQADRPTKPYAQNSWAYACVNEIIQACRSVRMMISTTDDKIVESGEAYDLLMNNTEIPFSKFLTDTVGLLAMYRTAYWVFLDKDLVAPKSILIAGPNQLKPMLRRGVLVGYTLKLPGSQRIPLFIEDVYPLIDFNPDSPYRGVGAADVGELAISSSYQASLLNESTLANGGKIGNLITVPGKLDPEEKRFLVGQFEARHQGARNAGKTCLMTGGADVKSLAQSMADLQMIDLRKFDATEICAVFGVPAEVIGLNPEAQYAHGPAHQRFISNTIDSMLTFVAEHITLGILRKFKNRKHAGVEFSKSKIFCGMPLPLNKRKSYRRSKVKATQSNQLLFAWFAIGEHPVMQAMLRERIDKSLGYTEKGVPLNDIIDAFDLPFEHQPWGDDWWINMGLAPARYTLEAGIEGITGESLPEGGEEPEKQIRATSDERPATVEKDTAQQRLRIWRNWVTSWAGIEKGYQQSMRTFFVRQQRILIEKLQAALKGTKSQKADPDQIVARVVFDLKAENGKLKVINNTFFEKASELGIRQSLTETLGLKDDELKQMTDRVKRLPAVKGKKVISTSKIVKVNNTTQETIARQLRKGLDAGESLNELTARVKNTLGSNRARALRIARTQTAGAVSTGRHHGMKAAGIQLKSWITSGDDKVRAAHVEAGSKYAQGIPIDQLFEVGGDMLMYPADPAGSAGNIINCRCLQIARAAAGKNFELNHYGNFYSHSNMQKDKEHGTDN